MRQLASIRGLAIIAVIVGHSAGWTMFALGWWGHDPGEGGVPSDSSWINSPAVYLLVGLQQLSFFSVPAFLFAAGRFVGFITHGSSGGLAVSTIRSWLRNLLPPYLIWMTVNATLHWLMTTLAHPGVPVDLGLTIRERTVDYYFVPLLAEFYLLSPLLARLARRHPGWLLAATGMLDVLFRARYYARYMGALGDDPFSAFLDVWGWVFVWGWASFFALGLVVALHGPRIRQQLLSVRRPLTIVAITLSVASVVEGRILASVSQNYWDSISWKASTYLFALVVVGILIAWDRPRGWAARTVDGLGAQSYGIYLVQAVVVQITARLLYYTAASVPARELLFPVVLVVSGLGVPLLLMWLMAHSPLWLYQRQVFGGSMRARVTPVLLSASQPASFERLLPQATAATAATLDLT